MTHVCLHLGIGSSAGAIFGLPYLMAVIITGARKYKAVAVWVISAYILGLYASVPSILHSLGLPRSFTHGWWMNIFFFNPLISQIKTGGILIGETLLVGVFMFQYFVLMVFLRRTMKTKH